MRRAAVVLLLLLSAAVFCAVAVLAHPEPEVQVTVYDPNPAHPWNQLHSALFVRQDSAGTSYGQDSLDPLLWQFSTHLLEPKSHARALHTLDAFLQAHAEKLIQDPLKRAILQRDLWALFDWSVAREPDHPGEATYASEKRGLQIRLAEVMRRLALTPKEIEALPDNYAQAVASGQFAGAYDPAHPDHPFLPSDLFDSHGPWVEMADWNPPYHASEPAAIQHVTFFSGRSRFLIFMRLPAGRKATFDYLRELWSFPEPWIARPDAPNQSEMNPALPSFPAGTQVALVRQMSLFDHQGNLVPAPITESVQIRVYRSVTGDNSPLDEGSAEAIRRSGQDCYEIRLSRPLLFAGKSGGLRAVGPNEKDFFIFNAMGFDELADTRWDKMPTVTQECVLCHRGVGIASLNSRHNLVKPGFLQRDDGGNYPPRWWENDNTVDWKANRPDWWLLKSYWSAPAPSQ